MKISNDLFNKGKLNNNSDQETEYFIDYSGFWDWFKENGDTFHEVVKTGDASQIETEFFDKLSPELEKINDGVFFLTGMMDDITAELCLTSEGNIKNIVFVEELVNAAPEIKNWKFRALKPEVDIQELLIRTGDYTFKGDNLFFYDVYDKDYPDLVNLVVVYTDYKEEDKVQIQDGVYIFIDNFIGEYRTVTAIDGLTVIPKEQAEKELMPIAKLKDYLVKREQEFIEKQGETTYSANTPKFGSFKATINRLPFIGVIDMTALAWNGKASHPWILEIQILFNGNEQGLPDVETFELLDKIEDEEMTLKLKDSDGYVYVGRETKDNTRTIYFACKEFRKPSKLIYGLINKYKDQFDISYDIYKDKYWETFDWYLQNS